MILSYCGHPLGDMLRELLPTQLPCMREKERACTANGDAHQVHCALHSSLSSLVISGAYLL